MQKTADWFSTSMAIPHQRPFGYGTTKTPLANSPHAVAGHRFHRKQIVNVMRLTVFLLTVALLNVQASGLSQTVTLSGKDLSLRKVFSVIKEQTGYVVFGNNSLLENAKPVTVNAEKMPLVNFLNLVFNNQPLSYSIDGKTIFIAAQIVTEKQESKPDPQKISFDLFPDQTRNIAGLVKNLNDEPLGGASINLKRNPKIGTTTNGAGFYTLKGVQKGDTLMASFIGYRTSVMVVGETDYINFYLNPAENQLDKVVVQAYGTTTRRTGTGAITRVSGEDIAKTNVMNPLLALQGRVPGLIITPADGSPSGRIKVEVRGRKSLSNDFSGEPLIVIDGVPMTLLDMNPGAYENGSQGVSQATVMSPTGGQNALFGMNPSDIESMEILKDGAATAIYGSRGANGVILITTKRGSRKGGSSFSARVSQGMSWVTDHWKLLDTKQYLQLRREAFANDGITPTRANAPDLMAYDTTRYTDWQKELWGNLGKLTMINAALSGGNENTSYLLNGSYSRQTDITTAAGSSKAYGLSFSVNHSSVDKKFKVDFRGNYSRTETDMVFMPIPTILPPNSPPIYRPDGSLNFKDFNDAGMAPDYYPFSGLKNTADNANDMWSVNLTLSYDILKNLKAKLTTGYMTSENHGVTLQPIAGQNPIMNPTGLNNTGHTSIKNITIEPQLNYKIRFGGFGSIDLFGGVSYQRNLTKTNSLIALGFTNDAFLETINLAGFVINSNNQAEYKYAAIFGRMEANWDNKYVLSVTGRRDGSSRFGSSNQYGNFGSVGIAYNISDESWMKSWLPEAVSTIKLRSSFGTTGSDNVGDYRYLTQWSVTMPDPNGGVGSTPYNPFDGYNPLVSQLHVNPSYHWQTKKNLDLGFTLGLLKDRLTIEVSRYEETMKDQLVFFPVPLYTGFPGVTSNWPALLKNKGLEIGVTADLIAKKDWRLSVGFNISNNKNYLSKYPNFEQSPYIDQYKVGQSLSTVYLFHYLGVDPQTGKYSFEDRNKDGTVSSVNGKPLGEGYDDKYVMMDLAPKYYGGGSVSLGYKRWTMSMVFNFQRRFVKDVRFPVTPIGGMVNMPVDVLGNYWQKPGDIKRFAAPTSVSSVAMSFFSNSDGAYVDMKMIRLANVNIGYSMPDAWVQKLRLKSASFFVTSDNLFFISNTFGLDPEVNFVGAMPKSRNITAGLNITL